MPRKPKYGYARDIFGRVIERDSFKDGEYSVPDYGQASMTLKMITEIGKQINTLIETIENNEREISSLTRQRDELLPLLMNGQVIVK